MVHSTDAESTPEDFARTWAVQGSIRLPPEGRLEGLSRYQNSNQVTQPGYDKNILSRGSDAVEGCFWPSLRWADVITA